MSEYKGFVKKIGVKDGVGKNGRPWKLYSIKLEKEDGTEYGDWISAGFDAPKFKEGDFIKLDAEKNARGYLEAAKGSVQVAKNPPARAKAEASGTDSSTGSSSRGNYGKGGVDWNSAVARALELTQLLASLDALPIAAAKGEAGKAKRYAEVTAVVDKLTVKLYNDSLTLRLLETVADTVPDTKADGALPGDEDDAVEAAKGEDEDDF